MNSNNVLSTCKNLLNFLSECSYGIPVNGKITNFNTPEYFDKHYKLLSPKQFMHYMGGVCWDYVEFEAWYLAKNNLKFHKYYIATNTEDVDTHTFILVECGDKYLYIESSFKLLEGIYTIDNLQDAVQLITHKMFSLNKEASRYTEINYYVWEYTKHPPYGSNYIECMEYFTNGEPIYEYTAINTTIKIYLKKLLLMMYLISINGL